MSNEKYRMYNVVTSRYTRSGSYSMPDLVNGYQVTNIGAVTVQINGQTLFPSATPATILGDSLSVGGNLGEIYKGNMEITFATSERNTAFGYIQKVYPSKTITENQCSKLLDLVQRDILRIQDPMMYGNRIGVIAGNKYSSEFKPEIDSAIQQLKDEKIL